MRPKGMVLALGLCLLLTACQGQTDPAESQVTELQHGTVRTTTNSEITGAADPEQGTWLQFTVQNRGEDSILLAQGRDTAHGVTVPPGETGRLTAALDVRTADYTFQIYPATPGTCLSAEYTLVQSSTDPAG